ncbi:MAG: SoxR reducing system RseC family protein [Bacteroidales bacterium]|jgi:sigma-E factor negative regulatory protein RseC|nr:SoxR reducing system RseC family protein [Bacteroidales bacterium]MBQ5881737.1 SoxR reducing system RseC family protein [Bacteroidales bacterium]
MMENSKNVIKHSGVVSRVTPDSVEVEIVSKSACAACHAKGVCGASDAESKIIEVKRADDGSFKVGDNVNVMIRYSMGMKAVLLAYVIPLFIILVLLLTLSVVLPDELCVAAITVGVLALYFFALALVKKKLGNKFIFSVEKI